jgi:DNA-binding response OmpR family regulator
MLKGHEVLEAHFGLEGLRLIGDGPLDLVICDTALTDMDAEEFHRGLGAGGYFGRILFLVAHLDVAPRDHFGVRLPVLYKPIDAEMLLSKVDELLSQGPPLWDIK